MSISNYTKYRLDTEAYLDARDTTDPEDERIDEDILPLCHALFYKGFVPISSCWGHGRDNPHVYLTDSIDDAEYEKLARYLLLARDFYYAPWTVDFWKDINKVGHSWYIQIRHNEIYASTPVVECLEKYKQAILECAVLIYKFGLD